MSGDEAQMAASIPNVLKDTMLAGAAWLYSANLAKDNAVIG